MVKPYFIFKKIASTALILGLFMGLINVTNVYAGEEILSDTPPAYEISAEYMEAADESYSENDVVNEIFIESAYYDIPAETDGGLTEEAPQYYITTANLRLRTGPSLDDEIIRTVPEGTIVRVYDKRCGEWFSVSDNGTAGYMYSEFLSPTQVGNVEQTSQTDTEENRQCTDCTEVYASAVQTDEPVINIYGVELIEWSEARDNIIRRGVPLHITDVRTGTTFWMESFSNGSHADVVPRTREDTEALRSIFGGRWTWEPRAILVTVDGRTFAASISGMPHGSFNSLDNGMVGHICMHFPGSRTHNGNRRHENDHQNRVQEAFNSSR